MNVFYSFVSSLAPHEAKLLSVAAVIGSKIGGDEGKKAAATLSNLVKLQAEEKKPLTEDVLTNINKLLG